MSSGHRKGEVINLTVTYLAFTTDTLCRLAFGGSLNLQDTGDNARDWAVTMKAVARLMPITKQFPFLIGWVKKVPIPIIHFFLPALARLLKLHQVSRVRLLRFKFTDGTQNMHSRAGSFLNEQGASKESARVEERPELFHIINESALPPSEKTLKRIAQEGFALIAAGGETTARILTIATFHILANPPVLTRLQNELKVSMVDPMELPNLGVLRELPWLVGTYHTHPKDLES